MKNNYYVEEYAGEIWLCSHPRGVVKSIRQQPHPIAIFKGSRKACVAFIESNENKRREDYKASVATWKQANPNRSFAPAIF